MLWIILALIVVAAALLWWWGGQPVRHRATLQELGSRHVPSFLQQMTPGSVLMAERVGSPGFLQLALLTTTGAAHDVEFGFPDDHWSHEAFDPLAATLKSRGFASTLEANATGIPRFLRVRVFGTTQELTPRLTALLEVVATHLGWGPEAYVVTYRGGLRRAA